MISKSNVIWRSFSSEVIVRTQTNWHTPDWLLSRSRTTKVKGKVCQTPACALFPFIGLEPISGQITEVCNVWPVGPAVTFPAAERHDSENILYCLVTETNEYEQVAQNRYAARRALTGRRTCDLDLDADAQPFAPLCHTPLLSVKIWILLQSSPV